jgi:hypothetical protein
VRWRDARLERHRRQPRWAAEAQRLVEVAREAIVRDEDEVEARPEIPSIYALEVEDLRVVAIPQPASVVVGHTAVAEDIDEQDQTTPPGAATAS